jgi:O-acetylserine/cysteine efflux transporter
VHDGAMNPTTSRGALAALAAAGVLFGLTVPLTKLALGWLDPAWLAVARFALAAPLLAWVGRRHLRAACTPAVAAWGGVGYGAMVLLQNAGVERTSVGHAALVFGAVPALVAVVALMAGRGRSGPLAWAGFAVALGGVALVAGAGGGQASLSGDALVLLSAVCSAGFLVAQADLLRGRDPVALTAVQMTAAGLISLPVALTAGTAPSALGTGPEVAGVAALVVAGTLLPFALFAFGQARVRPEVAGGFVNLEPLVGAAVGVAAFGDPFGPPHALGALAILAGIALSTAQDLPGWRRAAPAT